MRGICYLPYVRPVCPPIGTQGFDSLLCVALCIVRMADCLACEACRESKARERVDMVRLCLERFPTQPDTVLKRCSMGRESTRIWDA